MASDFDAAASNADLFSKRDSSFSAVCLMLFDYMFFRLLVARSFVGTLLFTLWHLCCSRAQRVSRHESTILVYTCLPDIAI